MPRKQDSLAGRQAKTSGGPTEDKAAVALVTELMAIPGPGGQEGAVARLIQERLIAAGAEPAWLVTDTANRRTPVAGDTGNLCLKLPGRMRGPRRLLMAHMDTVPICVGCRPVRKGQRIVSAAPHTGLGADDRAGVAVVLLTALRLLESDTPHPPLTFLWTIQEEGGLHGARNLRKAMLGKPALAFNFDGGVADKVTLGATGGYRMQVTLRGLATHAGNAPERGISAIAIASVAIADLVKNGWHGDVHQDGRHGTSNVGVIEGGQATNVVTDRVTLRVEARSHDTAFRQRIVREIEQAFLRAVGEVRNVEGKCGSVEFEGHLDYESFRLSQEEPAVRAAMAAIQAAGAEPFPAVTNGGLDANWMFQHGIPTVTLGCGQINQHTVEEALDLDQFQLACRIAWRLATAADSQAR